MNLIIYIALLLLTAAVLFLPLRYVSSRRLQLLRVLFPSWRFFDQIHEVPVLFHRIEQAGEDFSAWLPTIEKPTIAWHTALLNPYGNLYLAAQSLVTQLVNDLSEWDEESSEDFSQTVSARLVRNLVEDSVSTTCSENQPVHFQFKISSWRASTNEYQDLMLSPVYHCGGDKHATR